MCLQSHERLRTGILTWGLEDLLFLFDFIS